MNPARVPVKAALVWAHVLAGALVALAWADAERGGRGWRRAQLWWHRRLARLLGLRVSVRGELGPGPVLLAGNHVSWVDVIALSTLAPMRFVAKSEVRAWPLLGVLAGKAGTLFLRRGSRFAAAATVVEAAAALREGDTVAFFPEGTSTDGRGVGRFYPALFSAAARGGRPVQAVTLRYPAPGGLSATVPFIGDDEFLPHLLRLLAEREVPVELSFGEPVEADGLDRAELAARARAHVVEVLEGAPAPADEEERGEEEELAALLPAAAARF